MDKESLASARENVRRNNLSNRIKIMEASTEGNLLLPLDEDPMGTCGTSHPMLCISEVE